MSDSFIQVATDGSGKKLDTRVETTNSEHRQVVVIGGDGTNANIAPVDATKGLAVDLGATGANATAIKVNVASGGIASGGIASGAGVDGWDLTQGTKGDTLYSDGTGAASGSLTALLKGAYVKLASLVSNSTSLGQAASSASIPMVPPNDWGVSFSTVSLFNGTTPLTPTKVKINKAAASTTELVALVAAKKIRILSMYLVSTAANTVTLLSHTTTANNDGGLAYAANGGLVLPFNPIGWFDTTAGEALDITCSGAGQVSGQLVYVAV